MSPIVKIRIKKSSKDDGRVLNQTVEKSNDRYVTNNDNAQNIDYLITKILMTLGFDNTAIENDTIRKLTNVFIYKYNVDVNTKIKHHVFLIRLVDYMMEQCGIDDSYDPRDYKVILRQAIKYVAALLYNSDALHVNPTIFSCGSACYNNIIFGNIAITYEGIMYANFVEAIGSIGTEETYMQLKRICFFRTFRKN